MRNTMKQQLLILAAGVLSLGTAAAQTPSGGWTLQQCIDFAQEHNTAVQTRAVQVDESSNSLSTARYSRLPDLNASVGYNASFGRGTGDDNTYKTQTLQTGSFDVSASMPLFQGFRINRTIRGNKLNLTAAMLDLERAREDVAVQVMTLYLQVLYNKELVGIAEQQLLLSEQQAQRSRELVDAGKEPLSTRYESEALVANNALALTEAQNNLQLALLDLSQAMNRESAAGFDIVQPELEGLLASALSQRPNADAIYDVAATNRPRILAERTRLASSENAVAIARSSRYPSLALRGGYGTGLYSSMDAAFWTQFRRNSSEFVGVSLSVPIFNRMTVRNNIRAAQLTAQRQQLALLEAEQQLRKEIEQAGYNVEAAGAKYRSSIAALEAARTAFGYAEEKAKVGRTTIYDFNDAKTRMERAESELVQAKFELVFRRKILDYYLGEPLTL